MNRSRIATTFVLALLIAGLASVFVMKQLNRGKVSAHVTVQRVVMAAKDLDVVAKLTETDLRLADWAVGNPPNKNVLKINDAVGGGGRDTHYKDAATMGNKMAIP